MVGATLEWTKDLERWLGPFLGRLGHKTRRRMCPAYVSGLIGPGESPSEKFRFMTRCLQRAA
jgi:hypothetical protein